MQQEKQNSTDKDIFDDDAAYYESDLKNADNYADMIYALLDQKRGVQKVSGGTKNKKPKPNPIISSRNNGRSKKKKSEMIPQESIEQQRRYTERISVVLYIMLIILTVIIIAYTAIGYYKNSQSGEDLLHSLKGEEYISSEGNYLFDSFDGYVTVGDSMDKVFEVLGLPESFEDDLYYYGNSYVIVENDIVVGYYRSPEDNLKITVGFREIDSPIVRGDSASRVVKKIGSPNHYLKYEWIYYDIPMSMFSGVYSGKTVTLTVNFDDNYKLTGYTYY